MTSLGVQGSEGIQEERSLICQGSFGIFEAFDRNSSVHWTSPNTPRSKAKAKYNQGRCAYRFSALVHKYIKK